jgi:amino acid transporter
LNLLRLLLGRPLANRESSGQKIGTVAGVPAMGLDALSSSAYGPEAALTMLMPLGAAGLAYIGPIMLAILALLVVLYVSYRQTIAAYPVNGGSYTVARENLGTHAGLLAATALMIDYMLNVAVGISAGIAALVSALPELHPYTLWLCLAVLAVLTLVNLRGTPESGLAFAIPTYLFILCLGGVLALGLVRVLTDTGAPQPVVPPPALPPASEALGLWLLLRAFASGCTAMTGVEAVSNGVGAFREPTVRHAHRTLGVIVLVLVLLLAGIAYLAPAYRIGAMDQTAPGYQSVLAQLTGAVFGHGALYYVTIASILAVLSLSANTSFVGFPRLCRLVAQDDFLPRAFAIVGRRLVYDVGILFLAASAALLLIAFGGITDRLIPLFAVGAFLAFTLSQAGMARHWQRALAGAKRRRERAQIMLRLAINGFGALATGGALLVIIAAKFIEGAWITIALIPATILLLKAIKHQYKREERVLYDPGAVDLSHHEAPVVLVPMERWNRLVDKALGFAVRLSPDVIAVHLTALGGPDSDEHEQALRRQWARKVERPARAAGIAPPRLVLLRSPYRRFVGPLLKFIRDICEEAPQRPVAVLVPELMKRHWWQYLLHTQRARRLRQALLRHGGSALIVISVPWYLEEPAAGEEEQPESDEIASAPAARAALKDAQRRTG